MELLCHPCTTTSNLPYRFPIFETSASALCGSSWYVLLHNILEMIIVHEMGMPRTSNQCFMLWLGMTLWEFNIVQSLYYRLPLLPSLYPGLSWFSHMVCWKPTLQEFPVALQRVPFGNWTIWVFKVVIFQCYAETLHSPDGLRESCPEQRPTHLQGLASSVWLARWILGSNLYWIDLEQIQTG